MNKDGVYIGKEFRRWKQELIEYNIFIDSESISYKAVADESCITVTKVHKGQMAGLVLRIDYRTRLRFSEDAIHISQSQRCFMFAIPHWEDHSRALDPKGDEIEFISFLRDLSTPDELLQ